MNANGQYWQQETNYTIDVTLNDKDHTLDGFETIAYSNNSPDTLHFIWFHVWMNAYKNDKTAFSDQLLENGNTKFYFSGKDDKGYVNRLNFMVDNQVAKIEDHPQHLDIVKIILPSPLVPGSKTNISTPFHVKLPYNFSRGGHDGQSYQVTQWYPKPAVYDKDGWHEMPYLDQGEFYSEFGNFNVNITVPSNYVVAATGELQNVEETAWLNARKDFNWTPVKKTIKLSNGQTKTIIQDAPTSTSTVKTLQYQQSRIHDFAWFADKRYIVNEDTVQLPSGKTVQVSAYYTRPDFKVWQEAVAIGKETVRFYSAQLGEYPYNTVKIVEGPNSFGGGMEYPTITVISPMANVKDLESTIVHEIGHNWFYGILATNERDHPWMDEGMNTFYTDKFLENKYGQEAQPSPIYYETLATTKTDQPIETNSAAFIEENYNEIAYTKAAAWMRYLENKLGTNDFRIAMQAYYQQWQFKHPQPSDFEKTIEITTGKNLDSVFALLRQKGKLPEETKGTQLAAIFDFKKINNYKAHPTKNLFLFGPAIGANVYDKIMIGAFITNWKLPPSAFQFFAAPLYATGSKKFNGLGVVKYSFYPDRNMQRIDIDLAASVFTGDQFTDGDGNKNFLRVQKIVPGLKFTFKEKNPRSTVNRYLQFKSFQLTEGGLRFYRDTAITGIDTVIQNKYNLVDKNRTLNQLRFIIENNRSLYPYRGILQVDQGKDFYRTTFTGNYFFNYPKNGGLDLRLFAGKFLYRGDKTSNKQFANDRYHLNMTGANGYEDYTYSDYFVGRNEFNGLASQQIMMRDGAFKIRTDLLANKVGRSDDWLVAANLSSTIPSSINPLSVLPFKIPLKVYLDVGTYADAWKNGSTEDRLLYNGGLQFSLIKDVINFYIPLVYSSVYRNYLESTIPKKERFWKKISFSIDLSNFNLKKLGRHIEF